MWDQWGFSTLDLDARQSRRLRIREFTAKSKWEATYADNQLLLADVKAASGVSVAVSNNSAQRAPETVYFSQSGAPADGHNGRATELPAHSQTAACLRSSLRELVYVHGFDASMRGAVYRELCCTVAGAPRDRVEQLAAYEAVLRIASSAPVNILDGSESDEEAAAEAAIAAARAGKPAASSVSAPATAGPVPVDGDTLRQIELDLPRTFCEQRDFIAATDARTAAGVPSDGSRTSLMEGAVSAAVASSAVRPGSGSIVDALRRVLRAFVAARPGVGYLQSMNFLAAFCLLIHGGHNGRVTTAEAATTAPSVSTDASGSTVGMLGVAVDEAAERAIASAEAAAFFTLDALCGVLLPGYYCAGMPLLRADAEVFRAVLAARLPAVAEHAASPAGGGGLDIATLFAPRWLLCLFLNVFPSDIVARVWDVMALEVLLSGPSAAPRVLLQTCVALVRMCEVDLLRSSSFADMADVLKQLHTRVADGAELMLLAASPTCALDGPSLLPAAVPEEQWLDGDGDGDHDGCDDHARRAGAVDGEGDGDGDAQALDFSAALSSAAASATASAADVSALLTAHLPNPHMPHMLPDVTDSGAIMRGLRLQFAAAEFAAAVEAGLAEAETEAEAGVELPAGPPAAAAGSEAAAFALADSSVIAAPAAAVEPELSAAAASAPQAPASLLSPLSPSLTSPSPTALHLHARAVTSDADADADAAHALLGSGGAPPSQAPLHRSVLRMRKRLSMEFGAGLGPALGSPAGPGPAASPQAAAQLLSPTAMAATAPPASAAAASTPGQGQGLTHADLLSAWHDSIGIGLGSDAEGAGAADAGGAAAAVHTPVAPAQQAVGSGARLPASSSSTAAAAAAAGVRTPPVNIDACLDRLFLPLPGSPAAAAGPGTGVSPSGLVFSGSRARSNIAIGSGAGAGSGSGQRLRGIEMAMGMRGSPADVAASLGALPFGPLSPGLLTSRTLTMTMPMTMTMAAGGGVGVTNTAAATASGDDVSSVGVSSPLAMASLASIPASSRPAQAAHRRISAVGGRPAVASPLAAAVSSGVLSPQPQPHGLVLPAAPAPAAVTAAAPARTAQTALLACASAPAAPSPLMRRALASSTAATAGAAAGGAAASASPAGATSSTASAAPLPSPLASPAPCRVTKGAAAGVQPTASPAASASALKSPSRLPAPAASPSALKSPARPGPATAASPLRSPLRIVHAANANANANVRPVASPALAVNGALKPKSSGTADDDGTAAIARHLPLPSPPFPQRRGAGAMLSAAVAAAAAASTPVLAAGAVGSSDSLSLRDLIGSPGPAIADSRVGMGIENCPPEAGLSSKKALAVVAKHSGGGGGSSLAFSSPLLAAGEPATPVLAGAKQASLAVASPPLLGLASPLVRATASALASVPVPVLAPVAAPAPAAPRLDVSSIGLALNTSTAICAHSARKRRQERQWAPAPSATTAAAPFASPKTPGGIAGAGGRSSVASGLGGAAAGSTSSSGWGFGSFFSSLLTAPEPTVSVPMQQASASGPAASAQSGAAGGLASPRLRAAPGAASAKERAPAPASAARASLARSHSSGSAASAASLSSSMASLGASGVGSLCASGMGVSSTGAGAAAAAAAVVHGARGKPLAYETAFHEYDDDAEDVPLPLPAPPSAVGGGGGGPGQGHMGAAAGRHGHLHRANPMPAPAAGPGRAAALAGASAGASAPRMMSPLMSPRNGVGAAAAHKLADGAGVAVGGHPLMSPSGQGLSAVRASTALTSGAAAGDGDAMKMPVLALPPSQQAAQAEAVEVAAAPQDEVLTAPAPEANHDVGAPASASAGTDPLQALSLSSPASGSCCSPRPIAKVPLSLPAMLARAQAEQQLPMSLHLDFGAEADAEGDADAVAHADVQGCSDAARVAVDETSDEWASLPAAAHVEAATRPVAVAVAVQGPATRRATVTAGLSGGGSGSGSGSLEDSDDDGDYVFAGLRAAPAAPPAVAPAAAAAAALPPPHATLPRAPHLLGSRPMSLQLSLFTPRLHGPAKAPSPLVTGAATAAAAATATVASVGGIAPPSAAPSSRTARRSGASSGGSIEAE